MFRVGDAVRVKAGCPVYLSEPEPSRIGPYGRSFGKKLVITEDRTEACHANDGGYWYLVHEDGSREAGISGCYLEPWNDAEEWDGSKWVAKKLVDSSPKPAIVCLREDGQLKPTTLAFVCDSTNEAFRLAEVRAKANPGKEYVVLQEKGSKRVEPKSNADRFEAQFLSDFNTGDLFNLHDSNDVIVASGRTINVSRCGNLITVKYDASGD